jgi:hypothetical protein
MVTPLKVVSATTGPPRKFGPAGTALWNRIQADFSVEDAGGIELLAQACGAADRVESLKARIDADGETISIRTGIKAHPALRDELANRALICRILQRLGLLDEPIRPVGRGPGRKHGNAYE